MFYMAVPSAPYRLAKKNGASHGRATSPEESKLLVQTEVIAPYDDGCVVDGSSEAYTARIRGRRRETVGDVLDAAVAQ